jgi:hypothetical protein
MEDAGVDGTENECLWLVVEDIVGVKERGALPSSVGVGLQGTRNDLEVVACKKETNAVDFLRVKFPNLDASRSRAGSTLFFFYVKISGDWSLFQSCNCTKLISWTFNRSTFNIQTSKNARH